MSETNKKTRKKIDPTGSVLDMLHVMSEGNPGGLNVLMNLMKRDDGLLTILNLDDMNIRGRQIWVAFKDHCGQDMDKLVQDASNRDQDMVGTVNAECVYENDFGSFTERAVESGASYVRA